MYGGFFVLLHFHWLGVPIDLPWSVHLWKPSVCAGVQLKVATRPLTLLVSIYCDVPSVGHVVRLFHNFIMIRFFIGSCGYAYALVSCFCVLILRLFICRVYVESTFFRACFAFALYVN